MAGLGDTLMKNRMLAESKAEREQAKLERATDREEAKKSRAFGEDMAKQQLNEQVLARLTRNRAAEQSEISTADNKANREAQQKLREAANANADLEKLMKETMAGIQSQVLANKKDPKRGFSNETANKHWLEFLNQLTPAQQKAYKTSPFHTMWEDGTFDWSSLFSAKTESQSSTQSWEIKRKATEGTPGVPRTPGWGIGPLRFGDKPGIEGTPGSPEITIKGTGNLPSEYQGDNSGQGNSGQYRILETH
jgi:hypothetical protein